jgi:membrane protease YdiL (CAAX protease family)
MTGPPPVQAWERYRDTRPELDRLMAQMYAHDPRPWGWQPVIVPCAAAMGLIVFGNVTTHFLDPHSFTAAVLETILLSVVLYGTLIAAIYYAGRDLAHRYSGWGWAFGLQRPRWIDGAWVAAGFGMVLLGRIAIVLIANALTSGQAGEESQNLTVHSTSPVVYTLLAVSVVLIAPVVEETLFRGLLLRTFMRRLGFWPAALVSTAIFAAFHTYQVATLAGALTLAGVVFVLGLTNCLLVRWSGRLAAGTILHALFNALAVVILIVTAD